MGLLFLQLLEMIFYELTIHPYSSEKWNKQTFLCIFADFLIFVTL